MKYIQPRLDLVNLVVRPLLFTKSRLDIREKYEKGSWSLFIKSSTSLNRVPGVLMNVQKNLRKKDVTSFLRFLTPSPLSPILLNRVMD